ncbi:MAG: hypothetical protein IPI65_07220 [Bacteroidetes bacterium]|nr:hypothetical protein [Bacteroidota bacterium]
MDIEKIIHFLKTDIFGLIILGLVSSLIAGFLYDFIKSQYKLTNHKIKKRLFVKRLVKIAEAFGQGSRAAYAQLGTTFQQQVLIGDYIIKTIMLVAWILFYLIISIATLIILGEILSWIPVIIFSVIITIRYKKLRQHLGHYKQTFELAFGEEYFKNERKGQEEYWDELFKKKDEK